MSVFLRGITVHLPERIVTNEDLVANNPDWNADSIYKKIGIRARRVAAKDETAGDLGHQAAEKLLQETSFPRSAIDVLLFCTESPDFLLPSTSCVLQDRLGLSTNCGAFDYNLGCSGFTYGLWLARSLILSGDAHNVLLILADTYSKYCDAHDLTTVTIFGDAGAAALITAGEDEALACIGPSIVGTDGRGASNLIVRCGGARHPILSGDARPLVFMNGPEIFSFTLTSVRNGIAALLKRIHCEWEEIDWYLLHQANRFMLERIRTVLKVSPEKVPIVMEDVGNTVCATIPHLIQTQMEANKFRVGDTCVLAGFGVGYSWAMTSLTWCAPSKDAS